MSKKSDKDKENKQPSAGYQTPPAKLPSLIPPDIHQERKEKLDQKKQQEQSAKNPQKRLRPPFTPDEPNGLKKGPKKDRGGDGGTGICV